MVEILLDSNAIGQWSDYSSRAGLFAGQRGYAIDFGETTRGGLPLLWDGATWRMAPGAVVATGVSPSLTSPLATVTGSGKFNLPSTKLPPASIADGSRICVRARVKRTLNSGSGTTGNVKAWLGKNDDIASDILVGQTQINANVGHVAWLEVQALFSTAGNSFFATGKLKAQDSLNDSSTDFFVSTNIDRSVTMFVSFGIDNGIGAYQFKLIDYSVWVA